MSLTLESDGAVRFDRAALPILSELRVIADTQPVTRAGLRLHGVDELLSYLDLDDALGSLVLPLLGDRGRPVRAILFDKTVGMNWALGWHQDRTIVVRERIDVPGFGPWTIKSGMIHVEPPPALLDRMLTMRIHLDHVPVDNAPLLVAPGSHTFGRIAECDIESVVSRCGTRCCLAAAGDVWLYATPILHASIAASRPAHRRVLQVDFSADSLPGGLMWLGLG